MNQNNSEEIVMKTKRWMAAIVCLSVLATGMMSLSGCGTTVQAANLMEGIAANPVSGKAADDAFKNSSADFAIKLFQQTRDGNKNSLISPLSVMLALSMTANGAKGETLAQMEALLGGDIPMETLNEYLYSYIKALPSEKTAKLNIANFIWFRDNGFTAEKAFLQKNADYYGAAAYKSVFDEKTLRDINNWVKKNTDGMIEKIIDKLDPDAALEEGVYELFRRKDGKWEKTEAEPELIFPSIAYSINSGFTADLSYWIPAQYKPSPNERYRFQATFQFQRGSELSEEMINSLEFEVKGKVDFKTDVPALCIKSKADAEIENDGFLAALCGCDWTVPISDGSGQMINTNTCGPGIGTEINLSEANSFLRQKLRCNLTHSQIP